jgi:hypothetical protein
MRTPVLLVLFLSLVFPAGTALAGRIFGDIEYARKPVPEGVLVTLQRAPKTEGEVNPVPAPIDTTYTDKVGSYKFMVKDEGKFLLTVLFEKETASLDVFSYLYAVRYDLILEKKDGKLTIRRK